MVPLTGDELMAMKEGTSGRLVAGGHDERLELGERAQGGTEPDVRAATEPGEAGARRRHVTTTDEPALCAEEEN